MGELSTEKNQTYVLQGNGSIFDSSKFWGKGLRHRNTLSLDQDLEKQPEIIQTIDSIDPAPKEKIDKSSFSSSNVKLYETISGHFIITRGWEDNNMSVYKIRRKNL
ncbi:hypothetical protein [Neobacillus niacini]|uniref:hypothetical protein n=1 Tax=Neobacillus niacini TaxID=86668 RepID=UPI0039830258